MGKIQLDLADDDGDGNLTINRAYAERYDNWRRLEEMQKCTFVELIDAMRCIYSHIVALLVSN